MSATDLRQRYDIDRCAAETLAAFGFDPDRFDRLRERLRGRRERAAASGTDDRLAPPSHDDLLALPSSGDPERERLAGLGRAAITRGQVGVLVLAGGMATRFGGGVKALAEVLPGMSFADVKLADLRRRQAELSCAIPLWLMTSFQTDAALRGWAAAARAHSGPPVGPPVGSPVGLPVGPEISPGFAPQGVSMRLTPEGELFRTPEGRVSLHAPGHGDAPWAMRRSGLLAAFAAAGGRYLFLSNVDNAAATLDPAVLGAHLAGGRPLTCEVVEGYAVGGAPWHLNGRLQIVEAFRLPPDADPLAPGVISTNSLVADIEVFQAAWPLEWFEVYKQTDGVDVVQFERLIGQLSAFVDTTMLLVDSDGPDGRFQPVKDPADLAARRPEIRRILAARNILVAR